MPQPGTALSQPSSSDISTLGASTSNGRTSSLFEVNKGDMSWIYDISDDEETVSVESRSFDSEEDQGEAPVIHIPENAEPMAVEPEQLVNQQDTPAR